LKRPAPCLDTGSVRAWNVDGKQVTVDLAGPRPQTIRHVQVSALLGPVFDPNARTDLSQNRFTALRQFEIWTCNDPRPVAPMLLLRNFTFSPVHATHLRIVARNTQCTGGPAYQGEQDADPNNATDCNSAGLEVQAFGANSAAQG
jgi:extracellular elastinolytic metalloproteinase